MIANDAVQDETLADHQEQLDDHSQQLDEVRGDVGGLIANDAVQDADIDKLQANDATQDTAINDLKGVTGAANKGELDAAYSGTNYIEGSASMVEADRRLDAAISDVSTRVDGIENRVDGLEDRIDKVGAMSAAIANLRTMGYDPAAPTEIAVGVGQYRDETGMALGLFHYPNRDFMLSLSVSTSGDEYMGGIGAIPRKSSRNKKSSG